MTYRRLILVCTESAIGPQDVHDSSLTATAFHAYTHSSGGEQGAHRLVSSTRRNHMVDDEESPKTSTRKGRLLSTPSLARTTEYQPSPLDVGRVDRCIPAQPAPALGAQLGHMILRLGAVDPD